MLYNEVRDEMRDEVRDEAQRSTIVQGIQEDATSTLLIRYGILESADEPTKELKYFNIGSEEHVVVSDIAVNQDETEKIKTIMLSNIHPARCRRMQVLTCDSFVKAVLTEFLEMYKTEWDPYKEHLVALGVDAIFVLAELKRTRAAQGLDKPKYTFTYDADFTILNNIIDEASEYNFEENKKGNTPYLILSYVGIREKEVYDGETSSAYTGYTAL